MTDIVPFNLPDAKLNSNPSSAKCAIGCWANPTSQWANQGIESCFSADLGEAKNDSIEPTLPSGSGTSVSEAAGMHLPTFHSYVSLFYVVTYFSLCDMRYAIRCL